jgi:catechol 2,3-dioxygenase-like lactoylglutathione lyase family enzyme
MALRGLELHHHAIRVRPGTEQATGAFFDGVLGLSADPGARAVPGIPLWWMDAGTSGQIHLFAVDGPSPHTTSDGFDPFSAHVALGCPDIDEAQAELDRLGVTWHHAGRGARRQLFVHDPSGNMIELHQIGTCRCRSEDRVAAAEGPAPGDEAARR